MASSGKGSVEDQISWQLEGFHISMDESDNYVLDVSQPGAVPVHITGHVGQTVTVGGQFRAMQQMHQQQLTMGSPAPGSAMPPPTLGAAMPPPTAGSVMPPPTAGSGLHAPTASATLAPGSTGPATPVNRGAANLQTEAEIASNVSFRSLHPGAKGKLPDYAFRSDLLYMSTLVDPAYAPVPRAANKFLAFLPNLCDMTKPMPMNMMPEEVFLLYDTLMAHHQRQAAPPQDPEESDLYGGSVNALPSDWLYHPAQQVQQSTVPPPPVVPAQVLTLIPAQPQVVQQVQPTSAQTVHHQLQQLPPQLAAQHPSVLPPQGPQIQQQGPAVAGQVPTAVHSIRTQPAGVVQPSTIPANIQQPGNPVLHRALIQAMAQQGNMGSVTMDDVGNLLLTSEITLDPKSINPKSQNMDNKGSDETIDSTSSSSSTSSQTRRRRCNIM